MRYVACLLCALLVWTLVHAGEEQDRYEEQAMTRCANHRAERALRAERGERGATIRDLEAAFPGKLPKIEPGKNDKEGEAWFELVTGGNGDEWRKTDAAAAGLSAMYERWIQRLELGPAPSIKKDEFLKFSKLICRNAGQMNEEANGKSDTDTDADKVFRILDLNSDGELTGDELSTGLRADKGQVDTNGDGRISKAEYREYFRQRVEKKTEALTAAIKANDTLMRKLDGRDKRGANGLPDWFTTLDLDKDGQISLFEWRKGGKDTALFQEMDLNGDGLLTKDEYLRYLKMREDKLKQDKREKEDP